MVQSHRLGGGPEAGSLSWLIKVVALLLMSIAALAGLLGAFEYPKFTACGAPAPGGGDPAVGGSLPDCY